MDSGLIVLGVLVAVFVGLILLVIRKMARGEMNDLGESKPDEALEAEALRHPRPSQAPPGPREVPDSPDVPAEPPPKALKAGLSKTRSGFMAKVNGLIFGRGLDPELVDELEEVLITSDIGVPTTERLLGDLRGQLSRKEITEPAVVHQKLREGVKEIISVPCEPIDLAQGPTVIMVIGVNGVGKTTTIGKLAAKWIKDGKKVVLAAGDTFRAAAVEQLEIWAERSGAEIVKGPENADPSSVIFDAVQKAQSMNADVCIADTAGRLHTKVNLMEELKKVRRVMDKAKPGAPHEVLLVLDGTTGQNAITQAKQFTAAVNVTSLALTKLDGTAKGGVVVAVANELKLPVRYIGIGEGIDDLREFEADAFVDALFERDEDSSALTA